MAKGTRGTPKLLSRGIGKLSRSATYHKRGLWAIKAKNGGAFPTTAKAEKPAAAVAKLPKVYPADDVPKPFVKKSIVRPTKLRAGITPGTVLILLAGRFKGKRTVFLKQLSSGLLLVTGPYQVNGVPLRRVNQAYVIATSTKVDVSSVDVSKFEDAYFKKAAEKKSKKTEEAFFEGEAEAKKVPQEKIDDQKAIDAALKPIIAGVAGLESYLGARFTLRSGVKPHELVF